MNKIIINLHDFRDNEFTLRQGVTTLGRASDNMIQLPDPAISSHHARIVTIFDAAYIEDLGSTNGTHLNGRKVQRHPLRHGDILLLGKIQLVFVNEAAAKKAEVERLSRTVSTVDSTQSRTKSEYAHHPGTHSGIADFEQPDIDRSTGGLIQEIEHGKDEDPEEITLQDIPTLDEALPLSQMRMKLSQALITRKLGSRPQNTGMFTGFDAGNVEDALTTVSGSPAVGDVAAAAEPPVQANVPDSREMPAFRSFLSGWKILLAGLSLLAMVTVILFLALWDIPSL